jgi:hypothetical protein
MFLLAWDTGPASTGTAPRSIKLNNATGEFRNGVVRRDTFDSASLEMQLIVDDLAKTRGNFPWMTAESRGVPV